MVEQYEGEEQACKAKRDDDQEFKRAWETPKVRRPRLQLDLQLRSGSTTSMSRMHTDLPTEVKARARTRERVLGLPVRTRPKPRKKIETGFVETVPRTKITTTTTNQILKATMAARVRVTPKASNGTWVRNNSDPDETLVSPSTCDGEKTLNKKTLRSLEQFRTPSGSKPQAPYVESNLMSM